MEFQNFPEISSGEEENLLLQKELNKIDNLIEKTFHSRYDTSLKNDEKVINRINLYFYDNKFESKDDMRQKQIDKLLSVLVKNNKNELVKKQFKPLIKPKIVSLEGKIFINDNGINNDNN